MSSKGGFLHFVVVTSIGDTVVYESSQPAQLPESLVLDVEFFLHSSLDTLELLCREKSDCYFPLVEATENCRAVCAFCPIGPYRLLLVVEPATLLKRDECRNFFYAANKILSDSLRNPMASSHSKIHSPSLVSDLLRQQLERLFRSTMS